MKLKEIANCEIGPNNKEQKELTKNSSLYSADDLIEDLFLGYNESSKFKKNKFILSSGDVVINLMTNKATVVSEKNDGKIMSQRIMHFKIKPNEIYSWYLVFLLNESEKIKQQEHASMEGTVFRRITAKAIKDLEINLPPFSVQEKIGDSYRLLLKNYRLKKKYLDMTFDTTIKLLQIDK